MSFRLSAVMAAALRLAWHGPLSAAEIVRQHGCASEQALRKFWQREKAHGRLPRGVRPYFQIFCAEPEAELVSDDRPRDRLLSALHRAHLADRNRGVNDEMPLQLLAIEASDLDGRFTPSPSRVRDFRRGRDAYVGGRMAAGALSAANRKGFQPNV